MLYRIFTPTIDKEPCFTEFSPQLLTKNRKKEELEIPVLRNYWSHLSDSNGRPTDYKSVALPAELKWHLVTPTGIEPMSPP